VTTLICLKIACLCYFDYVFIGDKYYVACLLKKSIKLCRHPYLISKNYLLLC